MPDALLEVDTGQGVVEDGQMLPVSLLGVEEVDARKICWVAQNGTMLIRENSRVVVENARREREQTELFPGRRLFTRVAEAGKEA